MAISVLSDIASKTVNPFNFGKLSRWSASGNGTGITNFGAQAFTVVGTATAHNTAITNAYTQAKKIEWLVTTASTSAVVSFRHSAALWWRGNAAGVGGFYYKCDFGPATGVATATNRTFFGLRNSISAASDVEPSTLVDCIGVGWDAADANIQIFSNDNAGTCSKIDLGASFPVPTVDRTKFYRIVFYCEPNGSEINYEFREFLTSNVANGVISSNIPGNTVYLTPFGYCSVGGTSSVIGMGFSDLVLATNY